MSATMNTLDRGSRTAPQSAIATPIVAHNTLADTHVDGRAMPRRRVVAADPAATARDALREAVLAELSALSRS